MQHRLPFKRQGFTLIELLVVIAIIGILSAIVLASLSTSRARAVDAQIKENLHTAAQHAALDYEGYPNSYGAVIPFAALSKAVLQDTPQGTGKPGAPGISIFRTSFFGDATGETAMLQAGIAGGTLYLGVTSDAYVMVVPLTATPNTFWCVDSVGAVKQENATPTAAAYASLTCP